MELCAHDLDLDPTKMPFVESDELPLRHEVTKDAICTDEGSASLVAPQSSGYSASLFLGP